MSGITNIEIEPLNANMDNGCLVTAKLTFIKVRLDLNCQSKMEEKFYFKGEEK